MGRRYLRRNVTIKGKGYGPAYGNAYNVPDDVAALIPNEDAWATEPDRPAKQPEQVQPSPRRRKSGGKS